MPVTRCLAGQRPAAGNAGNGALVFPQVSGGNAAVTGVTPVIGRAKRAPESPPGLFALRLPRAGASTVLPLSGVTP